MRGLRPECRHHVCEVGKGKRFGAFSVIFPCFTTSLIAGLNPGLLCEFKNDMDMYLSTYFSTFIFLSPFAQFREDKTTLTGVEE